MKIIKSSRAKRKIEPEPYIKKNLRSRRPRRRRLHISPVLRSSLYSTLSRKNEGFSALSVDFSSCSYSGDEVSGNSSRVSRSGNLRKRPFGEIDGSGAKTRGNENIRDTQFRRITRSYYKQKESERKEVEVEVSESSCVESNSGADCGVLRERTSKLTKGSENVKEFERNEYCDVGTRSEISCVEQISGGIMKFADRNVKVLSENKQDDIVSFTSCVESYNGAKESENRAPLEVELSEISRNFVDANFTVSNSESVVEQRPKSLGFYSDLVCTEQFSYDDVLEYSSSHEPAFSELQSEIFPENSDTDFSDCTPSLFLDSGSEFSERSIGDSTPSLTYSLSLEFRQQFSRSTTPLATRISSHVEDEYQDQPTLVKFEDENDEESYQMLRERERRQVFFHDYAEEYRSTTEYGNLVLQQRSRMVNWIVEQCASKELQQETMFLGVSLLDRFLSKGFFKNKRNLQIVGIACLVLAIRIEENQPYNSVRQKNFYIGSNVYSRCEVVAMEWLVQEVLNFQCFSPTIYNFLRFYLKAARADAEVEKRAKYLAVLALSDHEQLCYWPSTVAAGLAILASLESNQDAHSQRVIEIHIRTKENDLPECIKSLEWLLQYVI